MPVISYGLLGPTFSGEDAQKNAFAYEMEMGRDGIEPFATRRAGDILKEDAKLAREFAEKCAHERVILGQRLSALSIDIQAAKVRNFTL